jgi:integrase
LDGHPLTASKQELRDFIQQYDDENIIKTVRVIYRRYFETEIADSFSVNPSPPQPTKAPDQKELQAVYQELPSEEIQVAFLLLATSGLRRRELMELTPSELDLEDRAIYPQPSDGQTTKRQWVTFYSPDAEMKLREVFDIQEMAPSEPFITCYPDTLTDYIRDASDAAGTMKITPQTLRVWFCQEMSRLSVSDRHIDALCGRASRSVLAKHYSDFTPENLQQIYENAGISVLS